MFERARWNPSLESIEDFVSKTPNSPGNLKALVRNFTRSLNVSKRVAWAGNRIRKVAVHEFWAGDGKYELKTTVNDLSNVLIKPEHGVLPREISKLLPIPTTPYCRLVGKYKGSVPSYSGKVVMPSSNLANFARKKTSFDSHEQGHTIITFPGDFKYNCSNLVTMGSPKVNKLSYERMLNSIKLRGKVDLHLPVMEAFSSDAVKHVRINPKAFSGLQTSKMFGRQMRQSVKFTKLLTVKLWNSCIKDKLRPDVSLWAIGGREKQINFSRGEFRPMRTRMIMQCEDSVKLLGNAVLQPFTKRLSGLQSGAIMIGRSMEDLKFHEFVKSFKCSDNWGLIDADWSQFDNHVYESLIVTAFGLMRSCYPASDEIDRYFLYQCGSMVFKNVVLPESKLIYRVSNGLPSGHPYTSVIGSIINWIVWSVGVCEVLSDKKSLISDTRLAVLGDDTLLKFPYGRTERLEYVMQNMGMKIDPFVNRHGPMWSLRPGYSKTFLKKIYQYGMISWDLQSIINNLSFPPKNMSLDGEIQRVRMMMYTAPFDSDSTHLLTRCFYHLVNLRYESKHGPPVLRDITHNNLVKSWPISLNVARRWFVGIRDHGLIGFRQDEWDTRTVYVKSYNSLPDYTYNYSRYIMFGDFN